MEHVWSYLFTEKMHVSPAEQRILLTEAPMNPRDNRRRMIETMFEKYGFHSMQVSIQAMLTLYAQGLLSGCVLDSGEARGAPPAASTPAARPLRCAALARPAARLPRNARRRRRARPPAPSHAPQATA
jgi:hypothetical protein